MIEKANRIVDERLHAEVRHVIAREIGLQDNQMGPNPAEARTPGWDSLVTLEIVAALEAEFSVEIDDDDVKNCRSLDEACRVIERLKRSAV